MTLDNLRGMNWYGHPDNLTLNQDLFLLRVAVPEPYQAGDCPLAWVRYPEPLPEPYHPVNEDCAPVGRVFGPRVFGDVRRVL